VPSVFQMLKPEQRRAILEFRALLKDMENPSSPSAKLRRLIKEDGGGQAESVLTSDDVHTETYGGGHRRRKKGERFLYNGEEFEIQGVYTTKSELNEGDIVTLDRDEIS